jgi:hypothetical protein
MVELTVPMPDDLARRVRGIEPWIPTVLELGLSGFRTVAAATASEVMEFLVSNPSRQEVRDYHVSDRAQARLRRLLTLNDAGMLGEDEAMELDELQVIESIVIRLKARLAADLAAGG